MKTIHSTIGRDAILKEVLRSIEKSVNRGGAPGMAVVIDATGVIEGVITDGDVRKALSKDAALDSTAAEIMYKNPLTISDVELEQKDYVEYLKKIENRKDSKKIQWVIVVDKKNRYLDLIEASELDRRITSERAASIIVYGMGYTGLTLAISLAGTKRYKVLGVDVDSRRLDLLISGRAPFFERGLNSVIEQLVEMKMIKFSTNADDASGLAHIINVGTTVEGNERRPNLDDLKTVGMQIGRNLQKGSLVVNRSTVPVGVTRNMLIPILEQASGLSVGEDFQIAFCPERTLQGEALRELRSLPQIIGGYSRRCVDAAAEIFQEVTNNIIRVESIEAAEIVKLINNTYRDLRFAFANEVGTICSAYNLNAYQIIDQANEGYPRDPIPRPSPGVGGSCLPKDPYLYGIHAYTGSTKDLTIRLGKASRAVNNSIIDNLLEVLDRFLERSPSKTVAKVFVAGLAFKGWPETDDLRGSVSVEFINHLVTNGHKVVATDAVVQQAAVQDLGIMMIDFTTGFVGSDAVFFLNNHPSYRKNNIVNCIKTMNTPAVLFDGFSVFDQREIENVPNMYYATIGYMTPK